MKKPDIFDPSKKYVFTNWSDSEFEFKYANPEFKFIPPANADDYTQKEIKRMWEAEYKKSYFKTVKVPAGGLLEVPEWLAFLLCKHFVDREYVKAVEGKHGSLSRSKNGGKANEQADSELLTMSNSSYRDELEEKTIRPIEMNEESPVIAALREQIRKEERAKLERKATAELTVHATETVQTQPVEVATQNTTTNNSDEFAGVN